jgi:hypothetical protein
MKKIVKILLLAVVSFLLVLVTFIMFCYQCVLYPSPKDAGPTQSENWDGVEVYYSPIKDAAKTMVYFHGNNETLDGIQYLAEKYNSYGFSIVMMEYPGYGNSAGEPSEELIYSSANAVINHLIDSGVRNDQIVIVGYSLGTGVATEMAYRGFGSSLVLIAPYTSIPNVPAKWIPFLPMDFLIPEHFDTYTKSQSIIIPTLIVHGTSDLTIPYKMGEELSKTFPNATLITRENYGHRDYFDDETVKIIAEFCVQ